MVMSEIVQKIMCTSMEIMVLEARIKKKRILEFSEAMNMTMRDKLYKKFIKSHLMHQKHWLIIFWLGEIKQSFRKIYNAY